MIRDLELCYITCPVDFAPLGPSGLLVRGAMRLRPSSVMASPSHGSMLTAASLKAELCICLCMCTHLSLATYVYIGRYMYYVYMLVYLSVCVCLRTYTYMYMYMCVCMYACVCVTPYKINICGSAVRFEATVLERPPRSHAQPPASPGSDAEEPLSQVDPMVD